MFTFQWIFIPNLKKQVVTNSTLIEIVLWFVKKEGISPFRRIQSLKTESRDRARDY